MMAPSGAVCTRFGCAGARGPTGETGLHSKFLSAGFTYGHSDPDEEDRQDEQSG
jgi:hypothetical protein